MHSRSLYIPVLDEIFIIRFLRVCSRVGIDRQIVAEMYSCDVASSVTPSNRFIYFCCSGPLYRPGLQV